jgi:hypothetical protein
MAFFLSIGIVVSPRLTPKHEITEGSLDHDDGPSLFGESPCAVLARFASAEDDVLDMNTATHDGALPCT